MQTVRFTNIKPNQGGAQGRQGCEFWSERQRFTGATEAEDLGFGTGAFTSPGSRATRILATDRRAKDHD
jgi:hypothetical protein